MAIKKIAVENVGQAFLELLREREIEVFLANAGTDFASIVDGFAKFRAEGKTTPRPLLVPHEHVAVSMAHGYYLASGKIAAVMVHVTVGTANAAQGVLNASRSRVPLLFLAGRNPITEEGLPGSRNVFIHWPQEAFDQGGMLREYLKWEYELKNAIQLEAVVDRALEQALTPPQGVSYLMLPREVLAQPLSEITVTSPARRAVPSRFSPDPAAIEEAARILASSKFPLVLTTSMGRDPEAVRALAALAETGAIGVMDVSAATVNFPWNHPCYLGSSPHRGNSPLLLEADAILVIESEVPWLPAMSKPKEETRIIHLGVDPLYGRLPIRSFPCDVALMAHASAALPLLTEALRGHLQGHERTIEDRRRWLAEKAEARRRELKEKAEALAKNRPISFQWASACLNQIKDDDTIIVNEYPLVFEQMTFSRPGSYFGAPSSGGLGWGLGAALGVKLAKPEKTVIATVGDGSYLFGVPASAHFAARAHNLPFLTIIFNNEAWEAVKMATLSVHPKGWAASTGQIPLSDLTPTARFEEIIRAFDGYGERVEDPAELIPAVRRGLQAVKEGRQAVLNVLARRP
jgi:acetolactate synthase-1/2/3 large subunit